MKNGGSVEELVRQQFAVIAQQHEEKKTGSNAVPPFFNPTERLAVDHIQKWPTDNPFALQKFIVSLEKSGTMILQSNTFDMKFRNNPAGGTWLLIYLLKTAKEDILAHLHLNENEGEKSSRKSS